jgi:imidazoleglycerol-phosphate dehydratase
MDQRFAKIERNTSETQITVSLELDGDGASEIVTGIGFFDHMLTQIARHGLIHLSISATGDLHIDGHHTVEDTGIALGVALARALGDKKGINRYGQAIIPMDEALVLCSLDFSGRGHLEYDMDLKSPMIGALDTQLVKEFFRAVAANAGMTLHIKQMSGANDHHIVEAAFKAFGRALDVATKQDSRVDGVPSSKGTL